MIWTGFLFALGVFLAIVVIVLLLIAVDVIQKRWQRRKSRPPQDWSRFGAREWFLTAMITAALCMAGSILLHILKAK
jgi:hypothetical protein